MKKHLIIFSIMNEPKNLLTEKNIQIEFSKMHDIKNRRKRNMTFLGEQVERIMSIENKLRNWDLNKIFPEYAFNPAEQGVISYAACYMIYTRCVWGIINYNVQKKKKKKKKFKKKKKKKFLNNKKKKKIL